MTVRNTKRMIAAVATVGVAAAALSFSPTFASAQYAGFPDVNEGDWYASVVDWSNEHKVVNGFPDGTWAPNDAVNRAQAITILYNLNGNEDVSGKSEPFSDVNDGDWFYDAVVWGKAKGVANGYSGTDLFGPYDGVTREQAAILLMNYAKGSAPADDVLSQFPDGADVHSWGKVGMSWAIKSGVISGVDTANGKLLEAGRVCTRAEFVAMLQRVYQNMNPTTPDQPETPTTPSAPDKPTTPDTPTTPDKPTTPDVPSTPDTPSTPTTPDKPTTPDTPTSPSTPDKPTTPDTPTSPSTPDKPGTGNGDSDPNWGGLID